MSYKILALNCTVSAADPDGQGRGTNLLADLESFLDVILAKTQVGEIYGAVEKAADLDVEAIGDNGGDEHGHLLSGQDGCHIRDLAQLRFEDDCRVECELNDAPASGGASDGNANELTGKKTCTLALPA